MIGVARPVRVVLAKLGLDTHDRGIRLVARWLRDAGMEVLYLGPYNEAAAVADVALQEDADVIGISFLDGGHVGWTEDLSACLRDRGIDDVPIVVGGVIPADDEPSLRDAGAAAVLGPGTPLADVADLFASLARSRSTARTPSPPAGP